MILSNPVKSPATINAFFDHSLRLVSVDNVFDLRALAAARQGTKKKNVDVFVRIRLATTDVQIDLNSKFGCCMTEAVDLLKEIEDAGFSARGIQFHVGTQSWNATNYRVGVESSIAIMDEAKAKFGIHCDSINIGGGFPDPVLAAKAGGLDRFFADLATAISPAIERGFNIIAEPGRVVVSGACSAVCSIIGKSIRNGTPWLYLDDGAYGLFSGKFFDHKEFDFRVLTKQSSSLSAGKLIPHVVAGPTCDSIDIISSMALLPAGLSPGDVLCSHNMGAYSIVTACRFNGFGTINAYLGSVSDPIFSKAGKRKSPKNVATSVRRVALAVGEP
jgi:ornithine decarboxylase